MAFPRAHQQNRAAGLIGGVHYPTDIETGKKLGGKFHARLLKNPAYLRDLEKIKTY